ncbi:amino acid ABC transporter permease [Limosilactobacillus mucosae]
MDFPYMLKVFPEIGKYIPVTLLMAVAAMILAIIVAAVLSVGQHHKTSHWLVDFYVLIFRGFPTLVIFFVGYYGLPQLLHSRSLVPASIAATICLALKEGAYLVEIFRSGIASVAKSQLETGLALGMSKSLVYRKIIIPQAIRVIIPPAGNTFVGLLKETSLAFSIGVTEIFGAGKLLATENFEYFDVYLVVGIWYVIMIYVYTLLQKQLEKRMARRFGEEVA